MWLTKFKIAIVEKDTNKLNTLINNLPKLSSVQEMKEAVYLINEASNLVKSLKNDTSSSMKQLKSNLEFLKSTQAPKTSSLDIKS